MQLDFMTFSSPAQVELALRDRKWFDEIEKKAMAQEVNVKVAIVASPTAVVPAIVDYAEKNKVDLIITGTKGRRRSALAKLLLGSVASGIVTYANCRSW